MRGKKRIGANRYSPAEDETMRRVYPTGGLDACLLVMPGRSRKSLKVHACELGLFMTDEAKRAARVAAGRKASQAASEWRAANLAKPKPEKATILGTAPFRFATSVFSLGAAMQGGVQPVRLSGPPGRVHQSDDEPLELEV